MKVVPTDIPGCVRLFPNLFDDHRGRFVKTFHAGLFQEHGLAANFSEQYYSTSRRGVLRGLHFQKPPHDHAKLIACVSGKIFDAVVDLRVGSPTFRRHVGVELSAAEGVLLYVPAGLAHGLLAMTDDVIVVANMTSVFAAHAEGGVRWDSAGIAWPSASPLLSDKDKALPTLDEVNSPFRFAETHGR